MNITSTHWGAYRVAKGVSGAPELVPFEEDSNPSPIGPSMAALLGDKTRITRPYVRASYLSGGPGTASEKRGSDAFVAVSWEQAEQLVGDELRRVIDHHGNEAIYAGSYGWASAGRFHHAQSQIHRFLNCIGGYTRSVNTYSFAAAEVIMPHIIGPFMEMMPIQTSWQSIAEEGELVVAFGGMPIKNGQISNGGTGKHVQEDGMRIAAERGVRFVNISPHRDDVIDEIQPEWMPIVPNSDVAMMLALCHTLIVEDLVDHAFLDRYTVGYVKVRDYILGTKDKVAKDAAWAAGLTGIAADEIAALAREMAAKRTMVSIAWSLSRQQYGEQPFWAGVTLAALVGDMGKEGGGVGFGYSAANSVGNNVNLLPYASVPQGPNPVESFIPVARISDMLLNPGAPFAYDGQTYTYPEIQLVYWAGGNPFHHHQDITRMRRAWEKPATIIHQDWCWNASARHADIVLPCTTSLEREDLGMMPRDPYLFSMAQVVEPNGKARDDYDIFTGIARHMGVEESFTEGRSAADWQEWIWDESTKRAATHGVTLPPLAELRRNGWFKIPDRTGNNILQNAFFDDPMANPLTTPSGKIELFSEVVAGFDDPECHGHATWNEPCEWLGTVDKAFPLHLLSNQPKTKLHSQMDHGAYSQSAKVKGHEPVQIHPEDAVARGLVDGDIVRVFNDRGACLAGVIVTDEIMQGVVMISTGAWYDPEDPADATSLCKNGNPNMLAPDLPTSRIGQGPGAHTCLVDLEKFDGQVTITAYDPPELR